MGALVATRSALEDALRIMSADQKETLLELLSARLSGLREHWSESPSDFQSSIMEELERIEFRLRHEDKLRPSHDSAEQKGYFICRKCLTTIIPSDLETMVCPKCGTADGLELALV